MKKIIFIFTLNFIFFQNNIYAISGESAISEDIKKFEQIFSLIEKKRVGASLDEINKIKNPFEIEIAPETKIDINVLDEENQEKYSLVAIFGSRIKINDKWYKLGEAINGFKIKQIKAKSVLIGDESYEKEIFLKERNDKFYLEIK